MGRAFKEIIMKKYIIITTIVVVGWAAIELFSKPEETRASVCEGLPLPTMEELQKLSEDH